MIGYYVHHHGRGHLHRAATIARAMDTPVVALSSLPRPDDPEPFADWVELARDDQDADARDHDGHQRLHWAPLGSPGYRARMHRVSNWLANAKPDLVVVDVSVEVTTLCRVLGVPVVVVAGTGRRDDAAHQLAYGLADRILAPWPGELYQPTHLDPHAAKTSYVGAFSRFDGLHATPPPQVPRVLLLLGAGGASIDDRALTDARAATPEYTWLAPGVDGTPWADDVWGALCGADIVVTHAGMNALAEVAAARRPAIVVPQTRPFAEQATTGEVLRRHRLATVATRWPASAAWNNLLDTTRAERERWTSWNPGDGAARAAEVITGCIDSPRS
jgi:Glycosyltransferase family 28 C-terminal domain